MKNTWKILPALLAGLLAAAPFALAQNEGEGQGQALVTVLPKNDKQPTANVSAQSMSMSSA